MSHTPSTKLCLNTHTHTIQMNDWTTPDEITPTVYLGKSNSARNKEILHGIGITHVLMVGFDLEAVFPDEFVYKHIELDDKESADIECHFAAAYDFIEGAAKNGGKTLVHCHAGVSRSATIVVAYLMKKQGLSVDDAVAACKRGRPCIKPNRGFMSALLSYKPTNT
jgi:protein tyrosine phosphatase